MYINEKTKTNVKDKVATSGFSSISYWKSKNITLLLLAQSADSNSHPVKISLSNKRNAFLNDSGNDLHVSDNTAGENNQFQRSLNLRSSS